MAEDTKNVPAKTLAREVVGVRAPAEMPPRVGAGQPLPIMADAVRPANSGLGDGNGNKLLQQVGYSSYHIYPNVGNIKRPIFDLNGGFGGGGSTNGTIIGNSILFQLEQNSPFVPSSSFGWVASSVRFYFNRSTDYITWDPMRNADQVNGYVLGVGARYMKNFPVNYLEYEFVGGTFPFEVVVFMSPDVGISGSIV